MKSNSIYQSTVINILYFVVQRLFPDIVFAGTKIEQRVFSCDLKREKAFEKSELKKIEKGLKQVIMSNFLKYD